MVSVFLVFVAALSFCRGAVLLYEASLTGTAPIEGDLLVILLLWGISAVCFGSAAVLDGIKTSAQRMSQKLDELAGRPG